ncbi:DMT family transporter [Nostoc sp. PCC 9305]|uniref:DMT family transporter n=1 Tax=Nostoc sp. PCC 9305 TaxID=296636 RepID=UPI0039C6C356
MDDLLESAEPETQQQTATLIEAILVFIAVFMFSLAAILIKLSEQDLGPNATVFNRFWIATIVLGFWRGIEVFRLKLSKKSVAPQENYTLSDLGLLFVAATATELCQLAWVWSLTQTGVANANLLHNFTPVFVAFGGWLVLGHYFDKRFLLGLTLAIGGAIAIGFEDWQLGTDNLVGDGWALLSAVFFATNMLTTERLRAKFPASGILLWSCLIRSCWTFPLVLLTEDKLFPSSMQGWLAVISLAVFCQAIASVILAHQIKKFSSGFISLFLLLEPIFTAIMGWMIFGEQLSLLNWLALFVVLLGIYLAQSGQKAEKLTVIEVVNRPLLQGSSNEQ